MKRSKQTPFEIGALNVCHGQSLAGLSLQRDLSLAIAMLLQDVHDG